MEKVEEQKQEIKKNNTVFKDNFSKEIYEQTYKYGTDKDINDTQFRVAEHLASVEKDKKYWTEQFLKVQENFAFMPGGRITSNAGTGITATSLINCFVDGFIGEHQDSMEGIFDTLRRQGLILKSEGGYGFCSDVMRPRGAYVEGIANESPGSVQMLDMWDTQSAVITKGSDRKVKKGKQKIRKGAQMVTKSIWHPDIEEFITAKQTPNRLTKFNMSVLITDAFMKAVENNETWDLVFPDHDEAKELYNKEWDGNIDKWKAKGYPIKVYKTYENANELYELIMQSTYSRNEPGILFVSTINKLNNLWYEEYISATNPCLVGETWVSTKEFGPTQIKEIVGKKVSILLNGEYNETTEEGFFPTGKKKVYEIKLKNGLKIKATANHKFYSLTNWKQVDELKEGDILNLSQNDLYDEWKAIGGTKDEGWLIGNLIGDGYFNDKNETVHFGYWGENKFEMHNVSRKILKSFVPPSSNNRDYFNEDFIPEVINGRDCVGLTSSKVFPVVKKWGLTQENKCFNSTIEKGSSDFYKGIIGGFFDADGSFWGNNQSGMNVTFSQSNLNTIECLQRMLLRFGIESNIYLYPGGMKEMPDGKGGEKEYLIKDNYELRISSRFMVRKFFDIIYTLDNIKKEKFLFAESEYIKNPYLRQKMYQSKIQKITEIGEEVVFDCTVPGIHAFDANGFVSHNCGEQILPVGGVCLLGSFNLTQFITEKGDFNWEKLENYIPIAVRMLDNVNDVTYVPLEIEKWNLKNKRRIGLGILGYGSALLMMKKKFGSKTALDFTEKLMSFIANKAYESSALIAKEKGAFPLFDVDKYLESNYIKQALTEETIELIRKYGIRNSHLLSIQPTGNSSVLGNNVSGGLEPVFLFSYIRTSMQPFAPEGLDTAKNIDWVNKTFDSKSEWKWKKEGDENVLWIEFEGDVWKMDKNRGLLKESVVMDYSVRYLKEKGEWDENAEWASNTYNLTVDDHTNTMKVMAKYVDSAMSKTVNLPADYSYEDFKKMYVDWWKTGFIKGGTTYREGTMTSVLSAEKTKDADGKFSYHDAPKRPKDLDGELHIITVKGIKYAVLVGLMDVVPYELFAFEANEDLAKQGSTKGKIRKVKKGQYDYITNDNKQSNMEFAAARPDEQMFTRLISGMLRHGTNPEFILEQIDKCPLEIVSFGKAIARVLRRYIKSNEQKTEKWCEDECKIIHEEGCTKCLTCGASKCN